MKTKIQNSEGKKRSKGRPSKFESINIKDVEKLYKLGLTDIQVADFLDVNQSTLNLWKQKYPDFSESLKHWKNGADEKVEKSLYQRALGFEFEEVCTENLVIDGKEVGGAEKKKVTRKIYVGDVTAQIFWLKNRQPAQWRDKVDVEHSGDLILSYGHRKQKQL
jgi:hypothetical protein